MFMHEFRRLLLAVMAAGSLCWSQDSAIPAVAKVSDSLQAAVVHQGSDSASASMVVARLPAVAVMPLSARSVDTEALEGIASALGSSLLKTGKFRVLERSQMDQILREQGFQQSGACDGSECAVEVGKLLAVDHIVVGSVSRIGNTYSLTARMVNVGSGEVLRSSTRNSNAELDALVTDAIPLVARELSGETIVENQGERRVGWGWWAAGGAVAVGGVVAAIVMLNGSTSSSGASGATTHTATVSWGN